MTRAVEKKERGKEVGGKREGWLPVGNFFLSVFRPSLEGEREKKERKRFNGPLGD